MYGILGALSAWGWLRTGRLHSAALLICLAIAVGAADELHQRSVTGRSSDAKDWVADIAGVATGFTLVSRRGHRTALGEQQA
jgi:VanZ family protein